MKKRKLGRDGTTMVEVLVAFIVVMIMLLSFTKIVMVASNMLMRSQDAINRAERFNAAYYNLENADRFRNISEGLSFSLIRTDADGNSLGAERVELKKTVLLKFKDADTGMSGYRFDHEE